LPAWIALAAAASAGDPQMLRPGFNLFTPEQDVQLGQEARGELEPKLSIVRNRELTQYVAGIGRRLAKSPHAGDFPFSFTLVYDRNINAFSLPGGPVYLNTGSIAACENEAQLAGVMAHEMSHVALRHGTSQLSKQNLIALPAALAGAMLGNHSILGQLTRLGIGFGTSSVLLRFSRTAEAQADYNGAEIMADAGYNPIEMARFFEKLEAGDPHEGALAQFLSDHPNPGNRVQAVEDEVRQMPRRSYQDDSPRFRPLRELTGHLPAPAKPRSESAAGPAAPSFHPSESLRTYKGPSFSFDYPDNWQVSGEGNSVTVAPAEGLVKGDNGQTAVGYGMMASYYLPKSGDVDLRGDTAALVHRFESENAGMRREQERDIEVDRSPALLTTLGSDSPLPGQGREVDALVTVARREGLFYVIFIAPQRQFAAAQDAFETVIRSIRFR
jgi:predicted Zn-dependent protease